MPKPPLLGEVASSEAKMSERLYRAAPALFRSLERRPLSNLSVSLPLDSSPGRRALGKEVSFSMKLICVCWKTSRNAKASHFERLPRPGEVARKCQKGTRWHGEAVTERARMLTKSKKHSDTISVCQRHRIAVFLCFILPGLPSQALTRQLSQRESLWHNLERMQNTSSHPAHRPRAK